jgi:hypothetical protein
MSKSSLADLTPDQRFRQVAAILAKGVARYQQRRRRSESRVQSPIRGGADV